MVSYSKYFLTATPIPWGRENAGRRSRADAAPVLSPPEMKLLPASLGTGLTEVTNLSIKYCSCETNGRTIGSDHDRTPFSGV